MPMFYISFATDDGFLGATVVESDSEQGALSRATELGINPGGDAAIIGMPDDLTSDAAAEMLSYKDRLVGKEELRANGGKRLADLPEPVQERFNQESVSVCSSCNPGDVTRKVRQ